MSASSSSSSRKDDFKKGIVAEEQTQKRADQGISIRKQKRAEKLERKRLPVKIDFEGIPGLPTDAAANVFESLLPRYNKNAFIGGDLTQLKILNMIFGAASGEQLEKHINDLVMVKGVPVIIQRLVQGCGIIEPTPEQETIFRMCISTLYNLTGTANKFDEEIAQAIVTSGFLTIFRRHLELLSKKGGGSTPVADVALRCQVWEIIYNLIVSCVGHEARDTILADPLMGFPYGAGDENSLFMQEVKGVFAETTNETSRNTLIPSISGVICACFEHGLNLPPWLFILGTWAFLLRTLFYIQPIPYAEMDAPVRCTVHHVCGSFLAIFLKMPKPKEKAIFLLKQTNLANFMRKLGQLCEVGNLRNQVRVVETFVQLSELPYPEEAAFQKAARQTRCTAIMFHAINSRDERMRWQGFLLVGNYMADGLEYVMDMMEAGAAEIIVARAREDTVAPRRSAIFALMSMFLTCDSARSNMKDRKTAEGVMRTLMHKYEMFRWICPLLGMEGQERQTVDILNVIATSLEWDYDLTVEALALGDGEHKVADTLNRAVNVLRGERSTLVFDAASKVDALLNKKNGVERMELDLDVPTGLVDGVFHGTFDF